MEWLFLAIKPFTLSRRRLVPVYYHSAIHTQLPLKKKKQPPNPSATKEYFGWKAKVGNPSRSIGSSKQLSSCPTESIPKED